MNNNEIQSLNRNYARYIGMAVVVGVFYLLYSELATLYTEKLAIYASQLLNSLFDLQTFLGVSKEGDTYYTNIIVQRNEGWGKHEIILPPFSEQLLLLGLLFFAILIWSGSILSKILGLVLGAVFFFGLDVARVCLLMMIDINYTDQFDLFNTRLAPSAMVVFIVGYFVLWTWLSYKKDN